MVFIENPMEEKDTKELSFEERLELKKLQTQIGRLKSDLKEAEKRALTSTTLKEILHGVTLKTKLFS